MKKKLFSLALSAILSLGLIPIALAEDAPSTDTLAREIGLSDDFILLDNSASDLNEGLYAFSAHSDGYEYGYKDVAGNVVIDPVFYRADAFHEGLAYTCPVESFFGGYIDYTGKYILPPVFDTGHEFRNGKAIVSINGFYSIINQQGEFLLSQKYDSIWFDEILEKYICRSKNRLDILEQDLTCVKTLDNMYFNAETLDGKIYLFITDADEKRGVMEYETGKMIIKPTRPSFIRYINGVFVEQDEAEPAVYVYNKSGQQIFAFDDRNVFPLSETRFYSCNWETGEKYIYENGVKQKTDLYISEQLSDSLFEVRSENPEFENEKRGAIDRNGNLVIPIKYTHIRTCAENKLFAYKDGNIDEYDHTGKLLRQFEGRPIDLVGYNTYFYAYFDLKDTYYILDQNADIYLSVICGEFQISYVDDQKNLHVSINGERYTIVKRDSDCLIQPQYAPMSPAEIKLPEAWVEDNTMFLKVGSNKKYTGGKCRLLDNEVFSTTPVIIHDRTMIPIRFFAENRNAYIFWAEETNTAYIYSMGKTLELQIDTDILKLKYFDMQKNAMITKEIKMDVPAQIINGRTFIPLRVVSESLGLTVYWDESTGLIGAGTSEIALSVEQTATLAQKFGAGTVTIEELQRMDASLATQPYLDYISEHLLGLDHKTVTNAARYSNTIPGYEALIRGEKDLILVTEPSPDILEQAQRGGVELEVIPFSKEGFVFFVNAQNPVQSLTQQQLRDIYQGKITNWNEVGGPDLLITAYQRNQNSGSQTIMENVFMKDLTMADPLTKRISTMEGIIDVVAEFQEDVNGGLGYSVYYYAREMIGNPNVRLLALEGIAPSTESIREESYPAVVYYYAVKRKNDDSATTKKLLDFVLSAEGQACVNESGLVSVK